MTNRNVNQKRTELETSLLILNIGREILNVFRERMGKEEYDKMMSKPMPSCKCGLIKEGCGDICPKCEKENKSEQKGCGGEIKGLSLAPPCGTKDDYGRILLCRDCENKSEVSNTLPKKEDEVDSTKDIHERISDEMSKDYGGEDGKIY